MSKLDILRKIIREEVRGVIREELSHLLKEKVSNKPNKAHLSLKEQLSNDIVKHTNESSDPLMDLLNETKMSMTSDDYRTIINADASMAQGFGQFNMNTNTNVVESVDQMLANSKPAADVSYVQIDSVPDFTALMNTMKNKGQI